jgi:hypothetical protein
MSEPSRYDRWRRRLAPAALLIALGVLAYDTCESKEKSGTPIVLDLGAARPSVRHVRADAFVAGEPSGWFESAVIGTEPLRFRALLEDRAVVRLQVTTDRGVRVLERVVHPSSDPVTLSLEGELRAP